MIAGLGNPGSMYARSRHNVGFMVVDELSRRLEVSCAPGPGEFTHGTTTRGAVAIHLVKPTTFMNESGVAIAQALERHALSLAELLVVLDDFQLPLGVLRMRANGSDGGHKGLASVIAELGTEDVPRLRCGIGRAIMPPADERRDFVLDPFDRDEQTIARDMVERAAEAALLFAASGIHHAMNACNIH
jgi:PTH1 family peptidyl-tRNA hydrolase